MTTVPSTRSKRRCIQFGLRTLLGFMLVISLPLGWLSLKRTQAQRQRAVVQQIEELGGMAIHCGQLEPREPWPPRVPSWVVRSLGDDFFRTINYVDLRGARITDADLARLRALPQLRSLHLRSSQVTDTGMVYLEALPHLQTLTVEKANITDQGLIRICRLSHLRRLNLNATGVTDAGLVHLRKLTGLTSLSLEKTHVTDAGVATLKRAVPNLKITR
ncbi:MAG: hypothetical protein MUE50_14280 [Pirellulaceae bacterium]|jgi:hypothetical protein|nr:hypothetical protein [Pirellulaceae bacterium]